MKTRVKPKYYTNKKVKDQVDKILAQNARNMSNLGTGSKYDIGEEAVVKEWVKMSSKIKELDPLLYEIIYKQDDKQT